MLFLDGVYVDRPDGAARFRWVKAPTTEELTQLNRVRMSLPASKTRWFDGLPHTIVTVQGLRCAPAIGHFTAERRVGDQITALFDRMPPGTILVLTLTVRPQDVTRQHIAAVKRATVGDAAEATLTREQASAVEREMAAGNKLYPLSIACYLRSQDLAELQAHVNQLHALLLPSGLQPIGREADLLILGRYLRHLPMNDEVLLEWVAGRGSSFHTIPRTSYRSTGDHVGPATLGWCFQPRRGAFDLRSVASR